MVSRTQKEVTSALEDTAMVSEPHIFCETFIDPLEKKSPKPSSHAGLTRDSRSPPPRSFASPTPSAHSRATQKSRVTEKQSTAYPPLPPSGTQSNIGSASAVKYQRTYSRAPSLSPSDSPSQMKAQRNAVRSVGREPSLPPVPPSDADSQAEGDPRLYSQQSGDSEFRSSGVFIG
jgi:hypothetical protein